MACLCDKVCSIPGCVDLLTIGSTAFNNTGFAVQFTEIITGRIMTLEGSSDENGIVTVDTSTLNDYLTPNLIYEIRLFLSGSVGQCDPTEFTIDETTITCVELQILPTSATQAILQLITPDPATEAPVNSINPIIASNEGIILTSTSGAWTNSPTSYLFQWYQDDILMPGETNQTLITNQQAGDYYCIVTASNPAGNTDSQSNTITIPS